MRRFRLCAATVLVAAASVVAQQPDVRATVFPGNFSTAAKYDGFAADPSAAKPEAVRDLISEGAAGATLVAGKDGLHRSVWAAVDRAVRAEKGFDLEALRRLHDEEARPLLDAARRAGDPERVIAVFRRCPWSAAVHEALLDHAEAALRAGRAGTAARSFADVLERAGDDRLRARARVGLWLASADDPALRERAFAGAGADEVLPFAGRELSAAELRGRSGGAGGTPAGPAVRWPPQMQTIRTPSAWSFSGTDKGSSLVKAVTAPAPGRPVVLPGGAVLAAGPNRLALHPAPDAPPAWVVRCPTTLSAKPADTPGHFRPAVAGGRIYTRWNVDVTLRRKGRGGDRNNARRPADVAAFDLADGRMIWSTADDAGWDDLRPVGDPVVSEGRLLVPAVGKGNDFSTYFVVCLDAGTGATLWTRELLAGVLPLSPEGTGGRRRASEAMDVTHFGHAVTVAGGAVYVSTNMGAVARLDVRDGLVEWVRPYARVAESRAMWSMAQRHGLSPTPLSDGRVLFAPRDRLGAFVLDGATGALVWDRPDEPAHRIVGVGGGRFVLSDGWRLAALDLADGRTAWERGYRDGELRAVVSGDAVIAGAGGRWLKLSAATGELLDRADRPAAPGLFDMLAAADGSLIATALDPAAEPGPKAAPWVPMLIDRPLRSVWRTGSLPSPSADPADWDPRDTAGWSLESGASGTVLIAHDGNMLHVGLTVPAAEAAPRLGAGREVTGDRLEIGLTTADKRHWRFAAAVGADGRGLVENLDSAPPGEDIAVRARHEPSAGRLVWQVAIPMRLLHGDRAPTWGDPWRRVTLELAVRRGGAADPPVLRIEEKCVLQKSLRSQQDLAEEIAAATPDLWETYDFHRESFRLRSPSGTPSSEFQRWYLRRFPNSAHARHTAVDLDLSLRTAADPDPAPEVVKLLTEAKAEPALIDWYRRTAAVQVSQWIRLDPAEPPTAVALEFLDGGGWPRVLVWGDLTAMKTRNGQSLPGHWKWAGPLPAGGGWHELRFPMIRLDMTDRPFTGIAFRRRGGGKVVWDRTALVAADGREIVLIDDAAPEGSLDGAWEWTDAAVKAGAKAHVSPAATKEQPDTRHGVRFAEPFAGHLVEIPARPPGDPAAEIKLLTSRLPQMRYGEYAARLTYRLEGLIREDRPARQALRMAIVRGAEPDDRTKWLELFLKIHRERAEHTYAEAFEELLAAAKLPDAEAAGFRARIVSAFLRTWRVAGPFPNPDIDKPAAHAPEKGPFDAAAEFDGIAGKVGWKAVDSDSDRIALDEITGHGGAAVAYAICWVNNPVAREVELQVGSDDGIKLWVNRKLLLEQYGGRLAYPNQNRVKLELPAGWNEVLVRVDNRSSAWGFFAEFRSPGGAKPLDDMDVSASPPK
jgi:outer membrane protein assembly factor BamB